MKPTSNKHDIKKTSLCQSFVNLNAAQDKDSTWIPKIQMMIPNQSNTNVAALNQNNYIETDIVPYTLKPNIQSKLYNEKVLNYPTDCTLYFPGYDGVDNAEKLKKDIINAASKGGTSLKVDINDHYSARGNK